MKTAVTLVANFLLSSSITFSQTYKSSVAIEGGLSYPLNQPVQKNKAVGIAINVKAEQFFSKKFSGTLRIGYNYFKGDLVYWDGKMDKNFTLIPVLLGARYYIQKLYLGFETGAAFKGSKNVYTNIAVAPSFGYLCKRINININILSILGFPSIPENTFLQRGGYSYLGVKFGYKIFNK
jgi:hypothetical protein